MKLKVNIPYIRCEKTTSEWSKDEIYFAIYVASAKKNGSEIIPTGEAPVFAKVSNETKTGVTKGTQWTPETNSMEIDLGEAEAVAITVALYEKDDSKIYDQLKDKLNGPLTGDGFDFGSLTKDGIPENSGGWEDLLLLLLKAAFKYFKQDDLIGQKTIFAHLDNANLEGPRDIRLQGYGAKYNFLIDLQRTS